MFSLAKPKNTSLKILLIKHKFHLCIICAASFFTSLRFDKLPHMYMMTGGSFFFLPMATGGINEPMSHWKTKFNKRHKAKVRFIWSVLTQYFSDLQDRWLSGSRLRLLVGLENARLLKSNTQPLPWAFHHLLTKWMKMGTVRGPSMQWDRASLQPAFLRA